MVCVCEVNYLNDPIFREAAADGDVVAILAVVIVVVVAVVVMLVVVVVIPLLFGLLEILQLAVHARFGPGWVWHGER